MTGTFLQLPWQKNCILYYIVSYICIYIYIIQVFCTWFNSICIDRSHVDVFIYLYISLSPLHFLRILIKNMVRKRSEIAKTVLCDPCDKNQDWLHTEDYYPSFSFETR